AILLAHVGGAAYGAMHGWDKLFWNNPDYALRDIRFTTDGSLTREQALKDAKLTPGRNIFSYKLSAARDALQALPQVDSVEVRRYLPNRIEISVRERGPVTWVSATATDDPAKMKRTHLLDRNGVVFTPKRMLREYEPLPVIGGVEIEDLEPGKPLRRAEVVASLELLRRVRETREFKVLSVDVSKGYCFTVTDQRKSRLTFGLDDIGEQLQRLNAIQRETESIGQEIETVNLMVKRNIPVTFRIPPPPEPEESDTPEPVRPAKPRETARSTPKSSPPPREKSSPAVKKQVPSKPKETPKETPKDENTGVLKRFHSA
ncbi:MAG: FtsQ-type POTRA domain-containing protein, partial [Chthoniobacteraceae bacterium]